MRFAGIRSKILRRFFLSYLLIFSIPFAILGAGIYYNAVVTLKNEIEGSNQEQLQRVKDFADRQMSELSGLATLISLDPKLTPFMLKHQRYSLLEAIKELQRYKTGNAILEEILLYFHGDDMVYSSRGQTSLHTLTNGYYKFDNWDGMSFTDNINNIKEAIILPSKGININDTEMTNIITYLFPLPYKIYQPYGTLIFLIRESKLTDLIENTLGDFQGAVYIFDEQNQVLASKQKGTNIDPQRLIEQLEGLDRNTGTHSLSFGNTQYSVTTVRSQNTGWSFVTIMPSQQFLKRVIEMRTIVTSGLALVVLIGLGMSTLFSVNQSHPIRNLAEFIKKRRGHLDLSPKRHNEIEFIRSMIDSEFEHNDDLLHQIHLQRPLIREQMLIKLLKGDYEDPQEQEDTLTYLELKMSGSFFYVMLISIEQTGSKKFNPHQKEGLLILLSKLTVNEWMGYGVELIHSNAIAVLVTLDDTPDDRRSRQEAAGRYISDLIKQEIHLSSTIAIGKIVQEISQINRSLIEAEAAMQYKLKGGVNQLIFFDEIHTQQEQFSWYSIEEQAKFIQSIKQGDQVVAEETLKQMMAGIGAKEQSILLLKCMCFEVINTLFKTLQEMNISDYSLQIKNLVEFHSVQHLESMLQPLIIDICHEVGRSKEDKNTELRDRIVDFIHHEYKSNQINLEQIADAHKLSLSYVSRFIKEQTGYTFTDYVFQLRLKAIKKELMETNISVKDIITNNGYVGVSTFIDKFKKIEGVTPGEYRKFFKEQRNHS
jgi:YesN/AraC family two-component response regulator